MFDKNSFKFKLVVAAIIMASNIWFYNWLGPVEGYAVLVAIFNIPLVQGSMFYFDYKKQYIQFSMPKYEYLEKILYQTALMILALVLIKLICLPHVPLLRDSFNWGVAFVYCFVSVPLQVWIVRGCLQQAVHDILFGIISLVKDIKDDLADKSSSSR